MKAFEITELDKLSEDDKKTFVMKLPAASVEMDRLVNVTFVVEASAFEQQALRRHHENSVFWNDNPSVRLVRLGFSNGHPVSAELRWSCINSRHVLFVSPASNVFDREVLHAWLDYHFPVEDKGVQSVTRIRSPEYFESCLDGILKSYSRFK